MFVVDSDLMHVAHAKRKHSIDLILNKIFYFTSNEDDRRGGGTSGVSSNRSSSSENNFRRICELFNDEFEIATGGSSGSLFEAKLCINESRSAAGGNVNRV